MSKKTSVTGKQPETIPDGTTAKTRPQTKKERRNRSKKRRPEDVPGLIAALDARVLDQRTSAARDALSLRDALAKDPEPVVKGLVRDALAVDAVIMSRIAAELMKPGTAILDETGELHPLIVKHWPEVRGGILKSGKTLLAIEKGGQAPTPDSDSGEVDLSTLILEAQRDENDE